MADSYNELFGLGSHSPDANLEGWWPIQDDAASTTVLDYSGNSRNGALVGGDNTEDLTTAGPNSWLLKSLAFDGSDYVSTAGTWADGATGLTLLTRVKFDTKTAWDGLLYTVGTSPSFADRHGFGLNSTDDFLDGRIKNTNVDGPAASIGTTAWHNASLRWSSGDAIYVRTDKVDGVGVTPSSGALDVNHNWTIGADLVLADRRLIGKIADTVIFSRALSADECDEWEDGPELINTVAPALSGTETVGQTLSSTTGTWALDAPFSGGSNGTASYSYQWTRSDDGSGTGEANISGATSSTYTLQSADAGKFIRCFVRATNDGGFDPAADTPTAFTGAISGGGNRRRRLLICGART